ncbi:MAG: hypothetical protein WCP52_09965 [Bacteroidota bacterium]
MEIKKQLIEINGSIHISCKLSEVFDFISNYSNDKHWRIIVKETIMNTAQVEKNTVMKETIFLSRKYPSFTSSFICTEFEKDKKVSTETLPEEQFYSKNTREVAAIDDRTTCINYQYVFDVEMVKYALGIGLPKFLIRMSVQREMKTYLKALKKVMEQSHIES